LLGAALKKTTDRELIAKINYSLSSNYFEKGIEIYNRDKDDSFYKLSIQYAKKCLEVIPNCWQALFNIGGVYLNMRDWKQAIFYLSEAEKYLDKNNPNYAAVEVERNLAEEMSKRN
jgi:tetratricopeptide (TPR) repeat protein